MTQITIEGYENYIIFEDGVLINTNSGRIMKPSLTLEGYYQFGLFNNGKKKSVRRNRLIGIAYIPNPDNKPFLDHINRDRTDDRIENLRWATHSENMKNQICRSNTGLQFIYKINMKTYKQGFLYRFNINRPELKYNYCNKDLQPVIEFRNKFCAENDIEFNDS